MSELLSANLPNLLAATLALIVFAILGRLATMFIDRFLFRWVGRTSTELDDVILRAVRRPLYFVFLLSGLSVALAQLSFLPTKWQNIAGNVIYIGFVVVGFQLFYRLIQDILAWYATSMAQRTATTLDDQFIPFLRRLLVIVLSATVVIMVMQHFGRDITALVATLGVGSLAVALAAQSTLSDAINGFIIVIDRPFRIGDRIELLDLGTWGDVVDIGLRSTRVRTRDNRMVVVPNSAIGKSLIVNHSYPNTQYRVETELGIAYGSDIEYARQVMIDAVRAQDWVMKDKRIEALFLSYGDSALNFRVRCWIPSYVETRRVIDKLNSCLYHALNEAGIEIPFPHQVLYHRLEPEAEKRWQEVLRG
jgi:small-conductance mechanosensitive channel